MTRTAQAILAAGLLIVALAVAAAQMSAPPNRTSSAVAAAPSPASPVGTVAPPTTSPAEPPDAELDLTDGGDPGQPNRPEPTNTPTGRGSDTHHDQLPAGEKAKLTDQATKFWTAFSLRSPGRRKAAVAEVAVPYLAEQMIVARTDRIPILRVRRTAVLPSSFSSATTVSQMTTGRWWYVVFVYNPDHDTWMAQEYEQATPGMISDARATTRG